ncbi:transposable element Tcb1 transposase [Trichonephila clavipes]|nr:transposable element Tcb1 transposase [Trichonephila clavipes]
MSAPECDMDSYRNEMGRPPPSAKNAITQTHTTHPIDKMTEKKINLYDNSKSNSNRKKEREKKKKQRSAFAQIFEFYRGRIVAYRDCGLSFRKIGSRVGRNQTTVMRICDRWMQEGTTNRRGRSHPRQYTTSREDSLPLTRSHRRLRHQWCDERRMWVAEWNEDVFTDESRICLQHHDGRIRVWRHRGEGRRNSCVMHRHTGPAPGIMITPPAATPDKLWQCVEDAWSALLQEHIQSLFESMPRRVAAVISNNGVYSGY